MSEGVSVGADETAPLQRCIQDIETLTRISAPWRGLDPTAIAECVLETLIDMLDLDLVGIRFDDAPHVFRRVGSVLAQAHPEENIVAGIEAWLQAEPCSLLSDLSIGGETLPAIALPLGDLSSMGLLLAVSRRVGSPGPTEVLRLRAAAQASLAMREVHELNERRPPADTRPEKPVGEALMESECGLEFQEALAKRSDARPIVVISAHVDVQMAVRAMKARRAGSARGSQLRDRPGQARPGPAAGAGDPDCAICNAL